MKKSILASLLIAISVSVDANETRHASAHLHGLNNVEMLLSQNQLNVMYQMPIVQINAEHDHDNHEEGGLIAFIEELFGHGHDDHEEEENHNNKNEHKESHKDEHGHEDHDENNVVEPENLSEKLAEFKDNTELFKLASAAKCSIVDYDSELHQVSSESKHKDIELSYQFKCSNPEQLNSVEFTAFKHFPGLNAIILDALINHKAISKKIDSDDGKVTW
jgi:hypothetical protein